MHSLKVKYPKRLPLVLSLYHTILDDILVIIAVWKYYSDNTHRNVVVFCGWLHNDDAFAGRFSWLTWLLNDLYSMTTWWPALAHHERWRCWRRRWWRDLTCQQLKHRRPAKTPSMLQNLRVSCSFLSSLYLVIVGCCHGSSCYLVRVCVGCTVWMAHRIKHLFYFTYLIETAFSAN